MAENHPPPKSESNNSVLAIVALVVGLLIGFGTGYLINTDSEELPVQEASERYNKLTSGLVQNVYANVVGNVTKVDENTIMIEQDGEELAFTFSETEKERLQLSVKESLTDAEKKSWEEFQTAQIAYSEAMQAYMEKISVDPTAAGTDEDVPAPPEQLAFSVQSEFSGNTDEDGMPIEQEYKLTSSTISLTDIKVGDEVQLTLSKGMSEENNELNIESVNIMRDMMV